MTDIIIKTQADLDALPDTFQETTRIIIQNDPTQGVIWISKIYGNASVYVYNKSSVKAFDNSSVYAYDKSSVVAYDNSSVYAYDNSSVHARGNSSVHATGNSSVHARGNSSVHATGNSSVQVSDNSSVQAYDNSSVQAYDISSVQAYDNSLVQAYDNSLVGAWDKAGVRLYSVFAQVSLHNLSVCWTIGKGQVKKLSKNATIIKPKKPTAGTKGWLQDESVKLIKQQVILFKRVSSDFKTQEGASNETLWQPDSTVEHADWKPSDNECGEGKFHACSQAHFCDQFRHDRQDDKYVALQVHVKDLHAWPQPQYPHKIAFRKATVLYQCDKFGKTINSK